MRASVLLVVGELSMRSIGMSGSGRRVQSEGK